MFVYDIFAFIIISLCHILLFLQLIQYQLSWKLMTALSVCFTVILLIVVTVTGYPEMNMIVLFTFLLGLGLLRQRHGLTFSQNVFFVLFSMVSITIFRMILLEISYKLFMMSPLNLYVWTESVLHLISVLIIFLSLIVWRKPIKKVSRYIIQSFLYYVIYGLLMIGMVFLVILSTPSIHILHQLQIQYGEMSYIISIIVFLVLLILFLISSHLAKERLLEEEEQKRDDELLEYVEQLEVMHEELASFRHDYVNVLMSLHEGIRTKNIDMVEQVYRDTVAPTSQMINDQHYELVKLSRITIPEVKSVLSVKVIEAEQQHISVFIDIPETIDDIAMPVVKFIRAISVILDNAIEEASNSKERSILIAFFEADHIQRFVVKNSCQDDQVDLVEMYEKDYSSKGPGRGYGLFSLQRLIENIPHASLETEFSYPYFTQTIALKKKVV